MATRDIGDGLLLRWSTSSDRERIANFAAGVFRDGRDDPPNEPMGNLVTRWLNGETPFMGPSDFVIVEDTGRARSPVVACACHLREDWTFDDVTIPVSRPEIVATDPRYRNRGIIREIFAELHARSASENRIMQVITGIPYFYRQFGYEYALDLGGRTRLPVDHLPQLPDGEDELCTLRPATTADLPHIADLYRAHFAHSLVSSQVPDTFWRYLVDMDTRPTSRDEIVIRPRLQVIELGHGEFGGFLTLPPWRLGDNLETGLLAFRPGTNVHALAPSLLRAMKRYGESIPANKPDVPLNKLFFKIGRKHPILPALREAWLPQTDKPYEWYVRVPDVPAFIRRVGPILERRIAASSIAGFDGELKVTFYRGGLRVQFESGKLAAVDDCVFGPYDTSANAGIPRLTFYQLLLGHRSLAELREFSPDVWVADDYRALIDTLFPKSPSHVYDI